MTRERAVYRLCLECQREGDTPVLTYVERERERESGDQRRQGRHAFSR